MICFFVLHLGLVIVRLLFKTHGEISVGKGQFSVSQISKQLEDGSQKQLGTEGEVKQRETQP